MRDKEYWHIPKSIDLHQGIEFLKGISENYQNKAWNHSLQDRMGSYLAKKGATNSGKNVTPQRLRTMMAGIPQFFGFVYKNTSTTPHTISVTEVGKKIVSLHHDDLLSYSSKSLKDGKNDPYKINHSEFFLLQFKKLQFTNPVILSDCLNLLVFPFELTLLLIQKLGYLSQAEIALFLFRVKGKDELKLKELEIINFRKLSKKDREELIGEFKKTDLGNKSLIQAPTTNYFMSLCEISQCFFKERQKDKNLLKEEIITLKINKAYLDDINEYLSSKEINQPFDFKSDMELWIDYYGNPDVLNTPIDCNLKNTSPYNIYFQFYRKNQLITGQQLNSNESVLIPIIEKYSQKIHIFNLETQKKQKEIEINGLENEIEISLDDFNDSSNNLIKEKIDWSKLITTHLDANQFDEDYLNELKFLEKVSQRKLLESKNLRGARLEYLFYKLLSESILKFGYKDIAELIWFGKLDQHGIPTPSPGGKLGSADLILFIENYQIVFEMTTIKAKSGQEKAEVVSVPDHFKNHQKEYPNLKTIGYYLAPISHSRITSSISANLINHNVEFKSPDIFEFLERFKLIENKDQFIDFLANYS